MLSDYLLNHLLTMPMLKNKKIKSIEQLFNTAAVDKTFILVSISEWLNACSDRLKESPYLVQLNLKPILLHELIAANMWSPIAEIIHSRKNSSSVVLENIVESYLCYGNGNQTEQFYYGFFQEINDTLLEMIEKSIEMNPDFLTVYGIRFLNKNNLKALNKKLATVDELPKMLIFVMEYLDKKIASSLMKRNLSSYYNVYNFKNFIIDKLYPYHHLINKIIPVKIPDSVLETLSIYQIGRLFDLITSLLDTDIRDIKLSKALFRFNFDIINKKYIARLLADPDIKQNYQRIKEQAQDIAYFSENTLWAKLVEDIILNKDDDQWCNAIYWIVYNLAKDSKLNPNKKAVIADMALKIQKKSISPLDFRRLMLENNISAQEIESFIQMVKNVINRTDLHKSYQVTLI